jgi:sodium/hydrogen exchanger-like protein 6/7/sodium/hydrogen exchanger 8
MSESTLFGAVSLSVIVVLFLYSVGGAFFEAKHVFPYYIYGKIHIIHETGLGIILGILAGGLFKLFYP